MSIWLTNSARQRRTEQANRRLISIGATPASEGVVYQQAPDLTRHGRDQIFKCDARRGDYVPTRAPFPEPTLFIPLHSAIRYIQIYLGDLPEYIYQFSQWFRLFAQHRDWREPVWNEKGDPNDAIFVAIHQAENLQHNLREIANLLEEDLTRLDNAKRDLEALLPDNYSPPWTKDEETGELWNNLTGHTHNLKNPHYL